MSEWIGSPIRGAAAALLALALVPEPAAATSPTAVDPARGLTEDFEAATVVEGVVSAPGLSVRPMRPDEAFPDRPRGAVASGGALSIMDVGAAPGAAYGAVRGRPVSTRDLSTAYGFVIALERSAASVGAAGPPGMRRGRCAPTTGAARSSPQPCWRRMRSASASRRRSPR